MPYYKRKAAARKYTRKPKRMMRRKPFTGIARAVRQSHKLKYFTETVQLASLSMSGTSGYKISLRLADLPNYAQYQQLFDEYCIIKYTVSLVPTTGTYVYGSSPAPIQFAYAINRDPNSAVPLQISDILSEDNSRFTVIDGRRQIRVPINDPKPWIEQISGTTGGNVTINQPLKKWVWVDMGSPDSTNLRHYGLNCAWFNPGTTPVTMAVFVKATVAFKEQQ